MFLQIATSWNSVTGGFNGLKGIPGLPGLDDISDVYYVAASVLLALLAFGAWLFHAPIGLFCPSCAHNESRLAALVDQRDRLRSRIDLRVQGRLAARRGKPAGEAGGSDPRGRPADRRRPGSAGRDPARPGCQPAPGWRLGERHP